MVRSCPIVMPTSAPVVSARSVGRLKRAQQRERLVVDADDLQPGAPTRLEVAVDDVPVCDDEQDAPPLGAVLRRALLEDDVVEYRLIERDREDLLRPEANRVLEHLRVGDALDLECPDADAIVRDSEPHGVLRQLVKVEEPLQRVAQGLGVADLAGDDETGLERLACDVHELGRAVVGDVRGRDLRRADLEPDELLRALLLALLRGLRRLRAPSARSCAGARSGGAPRRAPARPGSLARRRWRCRRPRGHPRARRQRRRLPLHRPTSSSTSCE